MRFMRRNDIIDMAPGGGESVHLIGRYPRWEVTPFAAILRRPAEGCEKYEDKHTVPARQIKS